MECEIYIRRAQTGDDFHQFVNFPTTIYQDTPELADFAINQRKMFLDRQKSGFNKKTEVECFLAFEGRELAGTIVTIINDECNRENGTSTGFLAFFETIQNRMVSLALFDIAHFWLKKQGMETLRGTIQYSAKTPEPWEQATEENTAAPQCPYYYIEFIESYGFKKVCENFNRKFQMQKYVEDFFLGGSKNPSTNQNTCGVSGFTTDVALHGTTPDFEKIPCYEGTMENCRPLQSYEFQMT